MSCGVGAVTLDNANITLHDIALYKIRRTTGQAIPFFEGQWWLLAEATDSSTVQSCVNMSYVISIEPAHAKRLVGIALCRAVCLLLRRSKVAWARCMYVP